MSPPDSNHAAVAGGGLQGSVLWPLLLVVFLQPFGLIGRQQLWKTLACIKILPNVISALNIDLCNTSSWISSSYFQLNRSEAEALLIAPLANSPKLLASAL